MATISFLTLQILNTWIESNNGLHNGLALSKGGKSQATGLSRYSRGNFISADVDGIVNLFEDFFLLEGCGVGLYSLSFYNLSVGSPYARPKKIHSQNHLNIFNICSTKTSQLHIYIQSFLDVPSCIVCVIYVYIYICICVCSPSNPIVSPGTKWWRVSRGKTRTQSPSHPGNGSRLGGGEGSWVHRL